MERLKVEEGVKLREVIYDCSEGSGITEDEYNKPPIASRV